METLVVTIFVLFIFGILYNSIVPLLGRYKELSYHDDLDVTYDLYHVRNILVVDKNYKTISNNNIKKITCDILDNYEKCELLYDFLEIDLDDEVIFVKSSNLTMVKNDTTFSPDLRNYIDKVDVNSGNVLIMQKNGYLSYLKI